MKQLKKTNLETAGMVVGVAALLAASGVLLYRWMTKRNREHDDEYSERRHFAPSYLSKHKPHHRKAKGNGQVRHSQGTNS